MSSAICFNLDQSKILLSGNGLIHIRFANLSSAKSFNFGECELLFGKDLDTGTPLYYKFKLIHKMISVPQIVENIVKEAENAD